MSLYRVKARWSGFNGAPGYSIFHFFHPDEGAGGTAEDAVASVRTLVNSWASWIPPVVTINVEGQVEVIATETGQLQDVEDVTTPAPVVGGGTGNYSAASGACLNWLTSGVRNGRRVRGRTFVVPLTVGAYDMTGTLATATLTGLQAGATAFADSLNGPVVYARPSAPGAADGVAFDIGASRVNDKVAVLRSRRD